jgi:hypothetical protein
MDTVYSFNIIFSDISNIYIYIYIYVFPNSFTGTCFQIIYFKQLSSR